MKDIVLSDETLNCYGFWVKTGGIDLSQFLKNPVMLYMHQRNLDDPEAVIGYWENVRIEGDRLMATPVFDTNSAKGREVARKYEEGFLKMASIGIDVTETSDDMADLLVGQAKPTVTKCKLREASIVDMGANDNAIVVSDDKEPANLAVKPGMSLTLSMTLTPYNIKDMKENIDIKESVLLALGLPIAATEEEVLSAIELLKKKASQTEELLKQQEMDRQRETAELINAAINEGKISKDNVELFTNIAEKNGNEVLRQTFACMQKPVRPTDIIEHNLKAEDIPDWDTCDKNGTLFNIKKDQPEVFSKMFAKRFGK